MNVEQRLHEDEIAEACTKHQGAQFCRREAPQMLHSRPPPIFSIQADHGQPIPCRIIQLVSNQPPRDLVQAWAFNKESASWLKDAPPFVQQRGCLASLEVFNDMDCMRLVRVIIWKWQRP
jgi:hypothetical protein